jgi:type II secretory pathway predicted ATPase ExeA
LTDFINKINDAIDIVIENNPNFERSTKVKRSVLDVISCYKEMHHEKKLQARQSPLDAFFKKKADNYMVDKTQPDPFSPT